MLRIGMIAVMCVGTQVGAQGISPIDDYRCGLLVQEQDGTKGLLREYSATLAHGFLYARYGSFSPEQSVELTFDIEAAIASACVGAPQNTVRSLTETAMLNVRETHTPPARD